MENLQNAPIEKKSLSASKFLALGYFFVILIGAILLTTPFVRSSFNGSWESFVNNWTNPLDALFTATSAACVTGLVTQNTATYWNIGGQIIILVLIQLGGLGFMSVISILSLILRRKINLAQRKIVMQASGMLEMGDVVDSIKRVVVYTLIFEITGALILSIQFVKDFGSIKGVWVSIFTAISAFCNAGFDLFGTSLVNYSNNPLVLITIMCLIAFGGLGFIVWENIFRTHFRVSKFKLHTKLVLVATVIAIVVPAILFYMFELNGEAFEGMSVGSRILNSFFQSVTCRTAGFNSFDISKLSNGSIMLSDLLMLIGGCSGSTAGGVKLTTMVVLVLTIVNVSRQTGINVGKRRIDESISRQASAVLVFYLMTFSFASMLIFVSESLLKSAAFSFSDVIFESISAIATVGLSTGGTANLTWISQLILIVLMYIGRTGGLTIIYIFTERSMNQASVLKRPSEKVLIG